MNRLVCFSIAFVFFVSYSIAQDTETNIEQIIADIFDHYTAESGEEIDFDTFSYELLSLSEQPLNLNQTNRESLEKMMFLNDIQIENILYYIYRNKKMHTIYELQLVEGVDMTDIRRMLPFVGVGEGIDEPNRIYKTDLFKYAKSDLLLRLDVLPNKRKGYIVQDAAGHTHPVYAGKPIYNYVKYKYHYRDRIYAGMTFEKDAGEKLFVRDGFIYDFKSFHVQLNGFGKFKTIVVGDYKAAFGQGLVVNTNFGMGKSSLVLNVNKRNQGLKKYSSTNEYNFFRGMGATYQFKNIESTVFYSRKYMDADTVGAVITGFSTTGLHRTAREIEKRHSLQQQVFGINSSYNNHYFQVGATVVHTLLDFSLVPTPTAYSYHSFEGNQQTTASLNYRFRLFKFFFSGETAINQRFAAATINTLSFSPHSLVSLVLLQRSYSQAYSSFYAQAFGEGSQVSNEKGVYLGVEVRPYKKWKLAAYLDSFVFPWPKYMIDAPTYGKDCFLQADYSKNRYLTMFWRFKFEEKGFTQKEEGQALAVASISSKFSAKYQLNYKVERFEFKTVMDWHMSRRFPASYRSGFSVLQDLSYQFQSIPLRLDFRYQFFDATDYDNRFYSFERDVLYAFSIPMYYGQGSRSYVNVKYDLNDKISCWFKLAQTQYANGREHIGTGNEEIQGNRKIDIRFLLRFKF